MAQVIYDVYASVVGDMLEIEAVGGGGVIRTAIPSAEVTDVNELAQWLLWQTPIQGMESPDLRRRLVIDYEVVDSVPVVSGTSVSSLSEDLGRDEIEQLPGWSSWSAAEAAAWVEANVVDLVTAKVALAGVARAIIGLRDIVL